MTVFQEKIRAFSTANSSLLLRRKVWGLVLTFLPLPRLSHHTSPPIWHINNSLSTVWNITLHNCPSWILYPPPPDLLLCHLGFFSRLTPMTPWQFWYRHFWETLLSWIRRPWSVLPLHIHPLLSTYHIMLQMTLYGFLFTLDYMCPKRGIILLFIPVSQDLIRCRCSTDGSWTNQS